MNIEPISTNNNFKGKVIVKNKISTAQNYLFNRHKPILENMIKDMPFDLLAEQSKSKKTITLSTSVKGANAYIVRKNEQNFVESAEFAIEDAKNKSEVYQKMVRVNEILQNSYQVFTNIALGNFKTARDYEKKTAGMVIKNFEAVKNLPKINYVNVPLDIQKMVLKNSIKYRFYRMFSSKTPEEKQVVKMKKDFLKELKSEHKEMKVINIDFRTGAIISKKY
jgi:hypothetical protein